MATRAKFDDIGYWSEIKLDIVKEYAKAYSRILSAQREPPLSHAYIDAFAGSGVHISRETGEFVAGSPLNALLVHPPFRDYHLIDIDRDKVATLKEIVGARKDVHIYEGDCNSILTDQVFPKVRFEDYRRALCLLDPYGLHLSWLVMQAAGQMKSIDMFINFPVMDMNRNVLWRNPDKVAPQDIKRMDQFWGDESWRNVAYSAEGMLFDNMLDKQSNETIAEAFRQRLRKVAGFGNVSAALPMRNASGAIVYYLILASRRPVAVDIVNEIFAKYASRGA